MSESRWAAYLAMFGTCVCGAVGVNVGGLVGAAVSEAVGTNVGGLVGVAVSECRCGRGSWYKRRRSGGCCC